LPEGEAELTQWVYDRFRDKDERLARHVEQGEFGGPIQSGPVRPADWFRPEPDRECPAVTS